MPLVATRITYVTLDADRQIEEGQTIRVHNILVSNFGAGDTEVICKRGDGTGDDILVFMVPNNKVINFDVIWLAKDGFTFMSVGTENIGVVSIQSAGGVLFCQLLQF